MMRTLKMGLAAAGAAALLMAAGCSSGSGGGPTQTPEPDITIQGSLAVEANIMDSDATNLGGQCATKAGYSDMHDGAQVVVTDADGTTVGVGELVSLGVSVPEGATSYYVWEIWCGFAFSVDGVPAGSPTYGIKIGNRDPFWVDAADITDEIEMSLGDIPAG